MQRGVASIVGRGPRTIATGGIHAQGHTSENARRYTQSHSLTAPLAVLLLGVGSYLGIAMYSLNHEEVYDMFEKYMPFGAAVLDKLEETNHKKTIEIRKKYYEDNRGEILPYISRKTPSEAYSSAEYDQHIIEGHSKVYKDDLEDPLSPERFFDAQSGTVSLERKEYLPLLLLPDIRNPLISHISMSMNDLISSVNSSAASASTVNAVSNDLRVLAEDIRSYHPKHARLLDAEVNELDSLVDTHEAIKQEYLLIHPQSSIPHSLPFEMEYHNKLAREILKIERILVSHINRRHEKDKDPEAAVPASQLVKQGYSNSALNSASFPESSRSPNSSALPPASASHLTEPSTKLAQEPSADTQTKTQKDSSLFRIASSEDFEKILELQLQLTLISASLHDNVGLPINHYVQQMETTLQGCENKKQLLEEALKGVSIPADVDLSATLETVLSKSNSS